MAYEEKFTKNDTIAELDAYINKLPTCSERAKLLSLGLIQHWLAAISKTLDEFLQLAKEEIKEDEV